MPETPDGPAVPPLNESSVELTRHEEVANVARNWVTDDTVRVKTSVETIRVDQTIPRSVVFADVERETPAEDDDGKVRELPDGSISIPVLEEQIVVTRRTVVRERIIVRKRTVTETVHIEDEVRREHIDVEASEGIEISDSAPATDQPKSSGKGSSNPSEPIPPNQPSQPGRPVPFPGSSVDPRRAR